MEEMILFQLSLFQAITFVNREVELIREQSWQRWLAKKIKPKTKMKSAIKLTDYLQRI
jgi:hypothetical protein